MRDRWTDQGILYVFGLLLLTGEDGWSLPVAAALFALIYAALCSFLEKNRQRLWLSAVFSIGCFFMPLTLFLPLLCYECVMAHELLLALVLSPAVVWMCVLLWIGKTEGATFAMWLFAMLLAAVLAERTRMAVMQRRSYLELKDSSTEFRFVMQARQRELLEKQDYEIRLATLTERNRIAREIHDNVGHMLTRAILQTGALQTVYRKDDALSGQLEAIGATLGSAMDSIRESVHDLHNESLELEPALRRTADEFAERFQIDLRYDMSPEVPRTVKYCFLAVTREALSNAARHSDADQITLYYYEHPGFYQMSAEDNGKTAALPAQPTGIGLSNMRDRVQALSGTITFLTEHGFRILIAIPKNKADKGD